MSRESKILNVPAASAQRTIQHYESFGWELLALNGTQITMTRETQNPVYAELVKYQAQYENLMATYVALKEPTAPLKNPPFHFGKCLGLLLLAIVPGVLYIVYKVKQNNAYQAAYEAYQKECEEAKKRKIDLWAEIEKTVNDSRATFFSRQA